MAVAGPAPSGGCPGRSVGRSVTLTLPSTIRAAEWRRAASAGIFVAAFDPLDRPLEWWSGGDPMKGRDRQDRPRRCAGADPESHRDASPFGGALLEAMDNHRLLVESVKDYGIFMLDPGGRIVSWSEGAERTKGYPAEAVLGKHFSVFYPPEDVAAGKP